MAVAADKLLSVGVKVLVLYDDNVEVDIRMRGCHSGRGSTVSILNTGLPSANSSMVLRILGSDNFDVDDLLSGSLCHYMMIARLPWRSFLGWRLAFFFQSTKLLFARDAPSSSFKFAAYSSGNPST